MQRFAHTSKARPLTRLFPGGYRTCAVHLYHPPACSGGSSPWRSAAYRACGAHATPTHHRVTSWCIGDEGLGPKNTLAPLPRGAPGELINDVASHRGHTKGLTGQVGQSRVAPSGLPARFPALQAGWGPMSVLPPLIPPWVLPSVTGPTGVVGVALVASTMATHLRKAWLPQHGRRVPSNTAIGQTTACVLTAPVYRRSCCAVNNTWLRYQRLGA